MEISNATSNIYLDADVKTRKYNVDKAKSKVQKSGSRWNSV